ncbi:MAG: NAD(P)H-hydrate dehydratase [Thermodesulfobacteriota bacterium]|nr:NAD(P)H-hydrate dehydratase [Thermodesulfobacteriota bacterium]
MRVLSAAQMQELDQKTIKEIGLPGPVLMENAGQGAARLIDERYRHLYPGPAVVISGKGNNGGDGYVIARSLLQRGWQVRTLVLADDAAVEGDARLNLEILRKVRGEILFAPDDDGLSTALSQCSGARLLVDALFGTGLSSNVRGRYGRAIAWMNEQPAPTAAVDIPSGLDATTGRILGCCVQADLTVTFALPKIGHVVYPGVDQVGALKTVDIGIPPFLLEAQAPAQILVDGECARRLLPSRPSDGHKGTFGHLLIIGGSTGKSGAVALAAESAVRSGAGLVTAAVPAGIHDILEVKLTEPMTVPLPEIDGALRLEALDALIAAWRDKQALAIGPGLGQNEQARQLVRHLVRDCDLPLVIDADGLNALAGHLEGLSSRRPGTTVITPHPGEMARLAQISVEKVQHDRLSVARDFAHRHGVVVLLKGARTVIAAPEGTVWINASGNPGMASGGMGDVLTGVVGALLAQGMPAAEAAVLAAYLHGAAADRLACREGCAGLAAGEVAGELAAARYDLTLRP